MSSTAYNDPSALETAQTPVEDQTRLLLTLWAIAGSTGQVRRSDLTSKVKQKRKGKKIGINQKLYEELKESGAILIKKEHQVPMVSITDLGKRMLVDALKKPEFEFDGTVVPARYANALVQLIRELDNGEISASQSADEKINSYEAFKAVALQVYDQLNQDYNYDNLVPIYRIRRAIGGKVSRSQFSEWLLQMQADDFLQLQGGSVEDSAPDKIEDSISTEISGLRCYAKRLKA